MVDSTYWGSKTPKFSRTHVMTFFVQCIKVPLGRRDHNGGPPKLNHVTYFMHVTLVFSHRAIWHTILFTVTSLFLLTALEPHGFFPISNSNLSGQFSQHSSLQFETLLTAPKSIISLI